MRVNVDWLRDWVEPGLDAPALADLLTKAGLEVDAVLPVAGIFSGVVVAEIISCAAHPDAERLKVCQVSDGTEEYGVICGAPNAQAGLKIAFARVGAVLPDGRTIKAATIRGVSSDGMLCSAAELGISDESSGIIVLPSDAQCGAELRAYLALDDHILEIDLTPNRGDCFSVIGIAREICAARGTALPRPAIEPVNPASAERFNVRLDAEDGCARFVGRVIRNIALGRSSPAWLVERLRRSGIRAIHPVVDVTNYVMLELGQPLHAYDLAKLDGEIVVRWAVAGEQLGLLDGREIDLETDLVVISDRSGPIGLAGIMGGSSTAVEDATVDIFLEAAYFPPQSVAGRARRYSLHTDASMRFERGVDPQGQTRAIERATGLLMQIVGGEPGPVVEVSLTEHLPERPTIYLRGERLAAVIGQVMPPQTIEESLELLGMSLESDGSNAWNVTTPSFRFDLTIEEDLIEEVTRLAGYDSIPTVPEFTVTKLGLATEDHVDEERLADLLVARGYSEIISYSFMDGDLAASINPGAPLERLANPISKELAVMRRSLWPGLLLAADKNLSRQQQHLRLFEIGSQFEPAPEGPIESSIVAGLICGAQWPEHWDLAKRDVDFFDAKGDVESLLGLTRRTDELRFVAADHPSLRPGRSARITLGQAEIGWLGELHPALQRQLDLKRAPVLFSLRLEAITSARLPTFKAYSKFPSLRRDLAVVVAEEVSAEDVLTCVSEAAGVSLQKASVFDVYRGPGIDSSRKSIGLGLILQDTYRTLTDEDADRTVAAVVERLGSELGATIRT